MEGHNLAELEQSARVLRVSDVITLDEAEGMGLSIEPLGTGRDYVELVNSEYMYAAAWVTGGGDALQIVGVAGTRKVPSYFDDGYAGIPKTDMRMEDTMRIDGDVIEARSVTPEKKREIFATGSRHSKGDLAGFGLMEYCDSSIGKGFLCYIDTENETKDYLALDLGDGTVEIMGYYDLFMKERPVRDICDFLGKEAVNIIPGKDLLELEGSPGPGGIICYQENPPEKDAYLGKGVITEPAASMAVITRVDTGLPLQEVGEDDHGEWYTQEEFIENGFERQMRGRTKVYHKDGIAYLAELREGDRKMRLMDCHSFSLDNGGRYTKEEMKKAGMVMEYPSTGIFSGCQGTERYSTRELDFNADGKMLYEITDRYWCPI